MNDDWNSRIIYVHGKLNPYNLDYSLPGHESDVETAPLLQTQSRDMQQYFPKLLILFYLTASQYPR